MRKLMIFSLIIFVTGNLYSQNIKNVQQRIENGRVVVTYDLEGSAEQKYNVCITAENNAGNKIIPQITSGDIGNVPPGKNKIIYWEPQLEGRRLKGWEILCKLKYISKNMVFVEGGTFRMGSNSSDEDDEKPVHSITVDDFYISKYEVTQAEWKKVMGDNPSHFKGDTRPVEVVSWYDAVEFCNKKSEMEGLEKCYSGSGDNIQCDFSANGYRLPTEAEWEYAARGGVESDNTNYRYSGSNDIDKVAWYRGNSGNKTHQVGQKKANELGIYDMSGNVYEWCSDWYDSDYYENSPPNNPKGSSSGKYRVLRGGGWNDVSYSCRVANRNCSYPDGSSGDLGFRFVKSVE